MQRQVTCEGLGLGFRVGVRVRATCEEEAYAPAPRLLCRVPAAPPEARIGAPRHHRRAAQQRCVDEVRGAHARPPLMQQSALAWFGFGFGFGFRFGLGFGFGFGFGSVTWRLAVVVPLDAQLVPLGHGAHRGYSLLLVL